MAKSDCHGVSFSNSIQHTIKLDLLLLAYQRYYASCNDSLLRTLKSLGVSILVFYYYVHIQTVDLKAARIFQMKTP